jgi:hypothetical protein
MGFLVVDVVEAVAPHVERGQRHREALHRHGRGQIDRRHQDIGFVGADLVGFLVAVDAAQLGLQHGASSRCRPWRRRKPNSAPEP